MNRAVSAVMEALENRRLFAGTATVQALPISLTFKAAVAGTLVDSAGQGTGFTYAQPNKNGNEYQPALIQLVPASDELNLTTTGTSAAGGSWEGDNTQVNSLQDAFNATTGAFTISARLQGPLSYLASPSEQGGIVFGPDDDNYVKLVAVSTPTGQMLQLVDEQLAAGTTTYIHSIPVANSYTSIGSFSSISTLDLQLQANPTTGVITGSYAINGGTAVGLSQQLTLSGTEKSAFFSTTALAGLIAMAKNNLAPVTVGFDSFAVAAVAATTPATGAGTKLTGSVIGTAGSFNNLGNLDTNALDGNFSTYFDSTSSSAWVGLSLPSSAVITQVQYAPRVGYESRMIGGIFQGSSTVDFSSGVVNLFTITTAPVDGVFTVATITNTSSFQYVRYLGPTSSHGNVAELEFDGNVVSTTATKLTGTTIGTSGSFNNLGNVAANALDGNLSTYFDATSSSAWVGLALASPAVVTQVKYAPRAGYESRMIGGIFQGSSTIDFSAGVVNLFTITTAPVAGVLTIQPITNTTSFQYLRYLGPTSSHGNIAELEFDGTVTTVVTPPTKLTGTTLGTPGSFNNLGNVDSNALDGNLGTYFDSASSSAWVGLALASPAVVTQIQYAPRAGYGSRMIGGIFQGSSTIDFSSGVVNLFTITTAPVAGVLTVQPITNTTSFQYLRYLGPTSSHGNIAELEFDGTVSTVVSSNKLTGTVIGTAGSYNSSGSVIANAFDGSFTTYFSGPTANGDYAGLAFSSTANITQVQYAPEAGDAALMVGGIFQASNSPTFANGVINLFTITNAPAYGAFTAQPVSNAGAYEYVRYLGPAGSYGDVAELEFDGTLTGLQPPALQNPSVASTSPANGATGVDPTAFISCALNLPNVGAGADPGTLTTTNIYLYRTFDHSIIPTEVNIDAVGSVIVLQPQSPLDANTNYTFVVTAGVEDITGTAFVPFQMSFTTGSEAAPSDPNIAFQKVALPTAVNQDFSCVTMGPDGDLYATTLLGDIFQFPVNSDGTLGNPNTILSSANVNRLITGIAFDPSSTATNMTIWISSGAPQFSNAADFSGTISAITGSGSAFSAPVVYITGLPRSNSNHLNDQPVFGPDGALYWCQGSNTSMGAPDSVWGFRPEHLLNAAILRLNIQAVEQRVASGLGALNVQTDSLAAGQTAYNPYATGAPLTLYATGIRNSYDLIWDTNGHLYAPTNGAAAGGNIPATPTGVTPAAPALNGVGAAEDDYLYDIDQGGYYGHPDAARGQYIFGGANPVSPAPNTAIQAAYPLGTNPDPNYRGYIYDFGPHYSPDGAIEYTGNAFGGALNGALLITRYSGGKDIITLRTGASGQITEAETGIAGFTGYTDPVDVTEDPNTGDLYVADLGALTLTLLRPIASGASIAVSSPTLYFNDAQGTAISSAQSITITNTGNQTLAIPATGLSVTGTDGALFPIATKPTLPLTIPAGTSVTITIVFNAGTSALGLHTAQLAISSNDPVNPIIYLNLRALTTGAASGTVEPSLQAILNLFQIPDNVGTADSTQSTFTTPPQTPNDETVMQELVKAGPGTVTITPLASFGTSITPSAGVGYYTAGTPDSRTSLFTENAANSQTVSPVVSGVTSFDPGSIEFGLFAAFDAFPNTGTGTARFAYSEDLFNTYDTTNPRKIRFYPLKNADGSVVANAYVFAAEDSGTTYDFNDFVGIIRNVAAAPAAPKIGTQNVASTDIESAPSPTQFVFSTIQTLNSTTPEVTHTTNVLRLDNSGNLPLVISSITSSNAAFTVATPLTYPLTIAAGTTMDITLAYAPTADTGTTSLDAGTLTINSNDPVTPALALQLSGIWQVAGMTWGSVSTEPTLPQIVSTLGYTTAIANPGQTLNQNGQIATAGQEVLSTYWTRADTNLPVTVQEVGAFHTEGVSSTLYWYTQGIPTGFTSVLNIPGDDAQSLLPLKNDTTKAVAVGMFSPTGIFGFNVDKTEYSDDTLNKLATSADQGHHIRFWPVYDATGKLVPNTWLMAMDYTATLGNYNDNVYVISNMKPAPPATPGAPTTLGSIAGVTISWPAVIDPLFAGYSIYRSTNSKTGYSLLNSIPVTTVSYLDTTATPGTTYYYIVAATDTYGGLSGYSLNATGVRTKNTTAPAAPAGLTPVAASTGITLTWTANTEIDLAGYNVYRASSATGTYFQLNSSLLTQPTFTDTSAVAGTVSYYHVTAVNLSGVASVASATSATRLIAPPTVPTAVGSGGTITLTWTASSAANLSGYNVLRSTSATGPFIQLNTTIIVGATYQDTGAVIDQTSYYEIVAVDKSGNVSAPALVSAFNPDNVPPAQPTAFNASGSATAIMLTWNANTETDLAGYKLYRSSSAGGTFVLQNTSLLTSLSYPDSSAPIGFTSYYQLVAVDTSGNASVAATASAFRPNTIAPATPTGLAATSAKPGIQLTWTANTEADLLGYNLYSATSAAGTFTRLNSTPITVLNDLDTTAVTGKTTYYRLTAINTSGLESPFASISLAI